MLQYPYYKDLTVFAETNPDLIDLPLDNITNLMLKVTSLIYLVTVADLKGRTEGLFPLAWHLD